LFGYAKTALSTEYFSLSALNEEYTLNGTVIVYEKAPTLTNYEVACDKNWFTKWVHITQEQDGKTYSLTLKADDQHLWFKDESSISSMMGLLDVDLEFSPSPILCRFGA
jgi:hypothetical protein